MKESGHQERMDYEEAVMDTFPSRRVSIQAIDKLPKTQELRKHALKRWVALLGHIDFELLLKHATSISRTPLESQTFVKLLLRRLPVNHYTKNKEPRAKECKRCGFQDETISHAIYECRQSSIFWSQVHKVLQELLKQEIGEISLKDVVYFFPSLRRKLTRDQLHVLNVVHSVALYVLWSSRYAKAIFNNPVERYDTNTKSMELISTGKLLRCAYVLESKLSTARVCVSTIPSFRLYHLPMLITTTREHPWRSSRRQQVPPSLCSPAEISSNPEWTLLLMKISHSPDLMKRFPCT